MSFMDGLTDSMTMLASLPNTIFVGQGLRYPGQAMYKSFAKVPKAQRVEFPVAEDLQMGYCTGLALAGYLPVCVYPRMDFLILALNQLVNHLDKLPAMAGVCPKVIIRVAVGSTKPFNGGPQHTQDHVKALGMMLTTVKIVETFLHPQAAYRRALEMKESVIVVERAEHYGE